MGQDIEKSNFADVNKYDQKPVTKRSMLVGSVFIVISNFIYIGANYVVSYTKLQATEIALVRGLAQILVFGTILYLQNKKSASDEVARKPSQPLWKDWKTILVLILYSVVLSSSQFGINTAVLLMPIDDLIVLAFTTPVFTVALSWIVLRKRPSVLSVFLCFLIVFGDVLVVQPPFIFGDKSQTPNSSESEENSQLDYYIGVALCVYCAFSMGIINVITVYTCKKGIGSNILMFTAGLSAAPISLIASFFLKNRIIQDPTSLALEDIFALIGMSVMTIIAFWFITIALKKTRNPTFMSIIRSTEILISLVSESIINGEFPGAFSLIGSLLVLSSVLGMSLHDSIIKSIRWILERLGCLAQADRKQLISVQE